MTVHKQKESIMTDTYQPIITNLSGADLRGADLTNTKLAGANLNKALLT